MNKDLYADFAFDILLVVAAARGCDSDTLNKAYLERIVERTQRFVKDIKGQFDGLIA